MSAFRTEKKIASALNAAVQHNLDGLEPNEAVVKAAQAKGLNPEMACRLVEGYNIASSRAFLKSAQDKTANFPLADKEQVLKMAFYEADLAGPDYTPDTTPETDFWGGSGKAEMKVASLNGFEEHAPWAEKTAAPKRDVNDLMEQIRSQRAEHDKFASDCRGRMEQARGVILRSVGDIAFNFSMSSKTADFAEFEAEAVSEFGDSAFDVIDMAVKHAELDAIEVPRLDRDNYEKKAYASLDHPEELGFVEKAIAARMIHKEASRKLDDATRVFEEQARQLDGFVRKIAGLAPIEEGSVSAADMLGKPKTAGVIDVAKGALAEVPRDTPSPTDIAGGARAGIQKEYENAAAEGFKKQRTRGLGEDDEMELENMKRQVILQDLLLNDEILSTQDPQQVVQAYNALLTINPRATLVPDVARSVLRNSVSSTALDTFTAEQMAKLESQMAKNQGAAPSGNLDT